LKVDILKNQIDLELVKESEKDISINIDSVNLE